MKKERIALFDFDGTLTRKDTFIDFAVKAVGVPRLLRGILLSSPRLILWKAGLIDGGKAKEHLFSTLYKGMSYSDFVGHAGSYKARLSEICRPDTLSKLQSHIQAGDKVYIVSASMPEWIIPWAAGYGIPPERILGTGVEVDAGGIITGCFATPNCNGREKAVRIQQAIPNLDRYEIYAYGNSSGDKPMLELAAKGTMV